MKRFPAYLQETFSAFKRLDSPAKVQDFLGRMKFNFERSGETCRSPLMVLKHREAHCLEGAMFAAAALWYHGREPLLLDLRTAKGDFDHVVALFMENSRWGAVSKTNHAVLRYRDPVYRDPRELAMSYFNEYFLDSGKKTMRSFSKPFSLLRFNSMWLTAKHDLWHIGAALDDAQHIDILPARTGNMLRKADAVEIRAGKITEQRKK